MVMELNQMDLEKNLIKRGFEVWYNHHFGEIDTGETSRLAIKHMCRLSWSAGQMRKHFLKEKQDVANN